MRVEAGRETELVRAAQAGDVGALEELTRRFYRPVCALAARLLDDSERAADAAQETFARVSRHLRDFDPERRFSAWVFAIAANLCRDWLRREWPTLRLDDVEEGSATIELPPDDHAIRLENSGRLNAAVAELPFPLKVVLLMRFQQDLEIDDIAQALEISRNAARIRLFRALKALREKVKE
jgi:RNA polymerase sigma-70 factor (ECF subfamily)